MESTSLIIYFNFYNETCRKKNNSLLIIIDKHKHIYLYIIFLINKKFQVYNK